MHAHGSSPKSKRSLVEKIASKPTTKRRAALNNLTESEIDLLEYEWRCWGRPAQFAPDGDWLTWLVLAGRGFGKTRCGAEFVRERRCGETPLAAGPWRHVPIIPETA